MFININKTVFIRFGSSDCPSDYRIGSVNISRVESVKDLGIVIDHKLSFKNHSLNVVKKVSLLSNSVLRVFKFCEMRVKYFIFKTYILLIVLYNIEFYYPISRIHKSCLEGLQRRFTKRICPPGLDYEQRLSLLTGVSIGLNHQLLLLTYMYKIVFSNILIDGFSYDRFPSITRGLSSKIRLPFSRTNIRKYFPLLRFVSLWNNLAPDHLKLTSVVAFKRFLMDSLH